MWIKITQNDSEFYINLDNVTNINIQGSGIYVSFCHAATQLHHVGDQFEMYWNSLYFKREDVSDDVLQAIKDQVIAE